MKKIAVFPGSFDPFTIGHESIVEKALTLFDLIYLAIGKNNDKKNFLYSVEERVIQISDLYKKNPKISVISYTGLTVDLCKSKKANFIIRGLRNSNDFIYENEISKTNKELNKNINTIYFDTDLYASHISSSIVRDIVKNGGDASKYLPER
tara:strand:+ start:238 stop:690 length:453 start_codon:yes stop_codon:yes gene_type:complete